MTPSVRTRPMAAGGQLPNPRVANSNTTGYQQVVFGNHYKQGEFYAYQLNGTMMAKPAKDWKEQGSYLVNDKDKLIGSKP